MRVVNVVTLLGVALVALLVLPSCRGREPRTAEGEGEDGGVAEGEGEAALVPEIACPGGPTCSALLDDGPLQAAAAKRDVTPTGFEIARYTFLRRVDDTSCAPEVPLYDDGHHHCGTLKDNILDDCGLDGLCFTDEGWSGADADGSESDQIDPGETTTDYWLDCGRDRICPDNVAEVDRANGIDDDLDGAVDDGQYVAEDADGSEGDGVFQALWIAGYDNNRPAMGIKDPLWARAVVLRQGDTTLALCTVDAVGIFFDEQERVTARIEEARPGELDLFLIQATHTHEAPDTMGQWGFADFNGGGVPDKPGRDEAHMELIRNGCTDAVVEALDALVAVDVKVGKVNPGVDGLVRDSRDPFIVNDTITAISLEDQSGGPDDGAVVATLLNWGNHPESLDSDNNFVSSDFVHAVRASLENGLPATTTHAARPARAGVALYLQGAVGGLLGPNGFLITGRDGTVYESDIKSWARTDALGENVAEHGFAALDVAETLVDPKLKFSAIRYRAPVENAVFHVGIGKGWFDRAVYDFDEDAQIGAGNIPHLQTGVAVIKLTEAAPTGGASRGIGFVTAPGELFPETFVGFASEQSFGRPVVEEGNENPPDLTKTPGGPYLRERLGVEHAMPLGLCQDEIGYLVEPYDYQLAEGSNAYIEQPPGDHYEETNSIGPQTVPALMKALNALFLFEGAR